MKKKTKKKKKQKKMTRRLRESSPPVTGLLPYDLSSEYKLGTGLHL
jgi:hypothetical protein